MSHNSILLLFLLSLFLPKVTPRSTCSYCCTPPQSFHPLPLEFYLPVGIFIMIVIYVWLVRFRDASKQWRKSRFESSHRFTGRLPQGTISYKVKIHSSGPKQFDWDALPLHTLTFTGNQAEMEEYERPETKRQGIIDERGIIQIPSLKLYATELPGTVLPGFISEGDEKLWVLLPAEYQEDPETIFPIYHNHFLMFYFGLIILMSFICMVIFWKMHANGFYADFFVYWPGTPWGVPASVIGLIVMFIWTNPFGMVYCRLDSKKTSNVMILFILITFVCFTFSVFDMIAADFMKGESMIDTRDNYVLDHEELADICQMNKFSCSVYWSSNLTKRTEGCKDGYYFMCISYEAVQNSCTKGNDGIYSLFFSQAVFQFLLGVCWLCVDLLMQDINFHDRLPSILVKIKEWNKGEQQERKTEMGAFREDSRLLGDNRNQN